ncbi:MAG TPA: response regulator, partial [bacterium]|nr:response regulator [bacterium]
MNTLIRHRSIFAADDYAGEQFLIRAALKGCDSPNPLYFFGNGQELVAALESLLSQGQTADLPCLILLDIKMPVMDGWEAMERIKGNPKLRDIPIVLLTNSSASEDSDRGFYLGAARYITKPSDLKGLAEEMRALRNYWGEPPSTPWRGDFG